MRDRGIGISAEDRPRLFRRFGRLPAVRDGGGLGLGLWIVAQLAEALGGTISVERAPGLGSTFAVELPLSA